MTMDEIEKLATELERHAQADVRTGRSPEDRHPARIAARAALLRAVEALELEAAKADSWRQAAEGFRRERDEARTKADDMFDAGMERFAEVVKATGMGAIALSPQNDLGLPTLPQAVAQLRARAEAALAAMRREVEDRRDRWLSADPAPSPFDAGTLRLAGTELRLMLARLAASPPTAALSTDPGAKPSTHQTEWCIECGLTEVADAGTKCDACRKGEP